MYGSTQPYFSIDTGDGERYDLIYLPLSEGLQAVAIHDKEHGETLGFHKIDDMLEGE